MLPVLFRSMPATDFDVEDWIERVDIPDHRYAGVLLSQGLKYARFSLQAQDHPVPDVSQRNMLWVYGHLVGML